MAGIYRRGRAWYLSWVEAGKQQRISLGRVTEAEAEAARVAKECSLHVVAAAGPLFGAWAQTYARWHSQEYPDSYYRVEQILRCHLIPAFGAVPLMGLTRDLAEAYKARRLQEVTPATVVKEWRTLQAALNHAVALEVIPRNPLEHVKAPRDLRSSPPRWFTRDELAAIYATEAAPPACITPADADLHRTLRWAWQLLAHTGMRRGEALQATWADVGDQALTIRSEPEARTKSGMWRVVPITRGAREALEHLGADRELGLHILPQIAPSSLSRAFARTTRRAGLTGHLHDLRHTYCSALVRGGVSLRVVQALAGHAHITTTERYAHLAPSDLMAAIERLDL